MTKQVIVQLIEDELNKIKGIDSKSIESFKRIKNMCDTVLNVYEELNQYFEKLKEQQEPMLGIGLTKPPYSFATTEACPHCGELSCTQRTHCPKCGKIKISFEVGDTLDDRKDPYIT
jgi:rubrerythrin